MRRTPRDELNNLLSMENMMNALDEIDRLTETEINELLDHLFAHHPKEDSPQDQIVFRNRIADISPRDQLKDEIRRGRIF